MPLETYTHAGWRAWARSLEASLSKGGRSHKYHPPLINGGLGTYFVLQSYSNPNCTRIARSTSLISCPVNPPPRLIIRCLLTVAN
jgi:hypothetical protein